MSLTLTAKVLTKDEFLLAYDLARRRGALQRNPDIYKQSVSHININNIENASSDELYDISITEFIDTVTKFDLAYIQKPSIIGIIDDLNILYMFAVDHNLDNERRGEVVTLYHFTIDKNDFIEYYETEDDEEIKKAFNGTIRWILPKFFALQRFYKNIKIDRSNRKRAVIDYIKYL